MMRSLSGRAFLLKFSEEYQNPVSISLTGNKIKVLGCTDGRSLNVSYNQLLYRVKLSERDEGLA